MAFGAIAIGALVPAAIMSIAAANLFTRNIYKAYFKPDATDAQEAKVSKIVSLLTKVGALIFVLTLDKQNALNFQLLGGLWILQTLPAIVFGLFTRWFHRWALLAGWAVGMVYGTVVAYGGCTACTTRPFGNSLAIVPGLGDAGYIGITALALNVVVAVVLSAVLHAARVSNGTDITVAVGLLRRPRRPGRRAAVDTAPPDPLSRHPLRAATGGVTRGVGESVAVPGASRGLGVAARSDRPWARPAASVVRVARRARTTASAPTPEPLDRSDPRRAGREGPRSPRAAGSSRSGSSGSGAAQIRACGG